MYYLENLNCARHAFPDAGEHFRFASMMDSASPPWGSKGMLNRVGRKIRDEQELTFREVAAIENWRAAHSYVLNTFKPLLWSK